MVKLAFLDKKKDGMALVMALFIMVVIMMLGIVFTVMMASESNTALSETQSIKALYLADAGLQYAQYSVGQCVNWDTLGSSFSGEFGEGSFSVVFTNPDEANDVVWTSSWGYIYDSTLGYSAQRYVGARLTK
jgi:hypothetical protein